MATVPVEITWVTGQVVTAAQLNANLRDAINFLISPPLAILRQTVAGSFTSATWTQVSFDTEDIDRDSGHSTVTNTSRYTAQTAGYYLCAGKISFASNATGRRWTRWDVNGSEINATRLGFAPSNGDVSEIPACSRWIFLNVGDFVELKGYQDSGGALNTVVTSGDQPMANLQWMST
jgi:hypothetical protein